MASSESKYWAGFDLGGTKMLATVFDHKFQKRGKKRKRTKGHEGTEAGLQRMIRTLRQALEDAELEPDQLAGIGVGCPGPVDLEAGVIIDAVNLGWRNVPLRKRLGEEFDCPVVVVNDVDAGVYGENRFGAARDARCVLGVFPGTGIGGGCVYDGQIIRGKRLSCMEFGHVQVTRHGRLCGCGLHGCLESEASRLAISAAAAKAAFRGKAPHLMKLAGTDLSDIRSGTLAEAVKAGDEAVEQIIRRAAEFIGIAVANFVHLLAPDVVVMGGGLVEAMPELLVGGVERAARESVMEGFRDSFRVVPAALGDDAGVMGAAAWAARTVTSRA